MALLPGNSLRLPAPRLTRFLAALLVLVLALPAVADQAKSLFKKGQDAEVRQDYEAAYQFYKQAYELKPKELTYRASALRTRFLAAASHVHNGQLLRNAGKLDEALGEFQKALAIDPSSFIAQQEARRTQELIDQAQHPSAEASVPGADDLARRAAAAQGPVELTPISTQPISMQLNEDSKVVYQAIGNLAGINVLFDPDYTSPRRIQVTLNGVTLAQALEIAALESKTFWRPVTPNTIFVAQDNPTKRKELEQSVVKTFYLSNLSQPNELQDVLNALRGIADINRVSPLATQDAIVVRGYPDQVALAEKIISDIDKARPEVVVDVVVMEVSRNKLRDLGIQPPASATVQLQSPITSSTTTTGSSGSGGTGTVTTTSTPQPLTLNQLASCGADCFTVSVPPATANFLFDDTATHIIQQPQVRSVDGEKASLKIGQRIPVATGSFQPGIGGVGINPLVNTQFQYQDVGVNIDITPRIHGDREVTLKVMLEISSVVGQQNIGGIQQPIIGQRKSEATIRLKEGEVNLMGGMMEQDLTKDWSGIPGLGQIPLLRYFFAKEHVTSSDSELVFALVPHIVRMQEVSGLNTRPVDVGTATTIELRTPAPTPAPAPAPPAAGPGAPAGPAGPGDAAQPAAQPQAGPAMGGSTPAAAGPQPQPSTQPGPTGAGSLRFDPPALSQAVGSTFVVNIMLTGGQDIASLPLQVSYDPNVLALVNLSDGGLLSKDGQPVALVHRDDPATGTLIMSASRPPNSAGVSGDGTVFTLTFLAKAKGQSALSISRPGARDSKMAPVPLTTATASVTVQ
ncbi:MAG TPA: cohesin domain-containing protein [Terriglobales bacterium]|jgi:general secretion pathway protein D|nr:cohesin domain-containing protein [Terriglobales bacterium]